MESKTENRKKKKRVAPKKPTTKQEKDLEEAVSSASSTVPALTTVFFIFYLIDEENPSSVDPIEKIGSLLSGSDTTHITIYVPPFTLYSANVAKDGPFRTDIPMPTMLGLDKTNKLQRIYQIDLNEVQYSRMVASLEAGLPMPFDISNWFGAPIFGWCCMAWVMDWFCTSPGTQTCARYALDALRESKAMDPETFPTSCWCTIKRYLFPKHVENVLKLNSHCATLITYKQLRKFQSEMKNYFQTHNVIMSKAGVMMQMGDGHRGYNAQSNLNNEEPSKTKTSTVGGAFMEALGTSSGMMGQSSSGSNPNDPYNMASKITTYFIPVMNSSFGHPQNIPPSPTHFVPVDPYGEYRNGEFLGQYPYPVYSPYPSIDTNHQQQYYPGGYHPHPVNHDPYYNQGMPQQSSQQDHVSLDIPPQQPYYQ